MGIHHLDDPCLDRFHDDMEAVVDDVLRNATITIAALEGWIRKRLIQATVDGYRRRRGQRGALQRPRVPQWLATRLDQNPTLLTLAIDLLEFVGNDVSAGPETWPTDRWIEQRTIAGIDHATARRDVLRDTASVLAAMRTRPKWYADYVERPLSRKRPPSVPLTRHSAETGLDPRLDRVFGHDTDPLVERAAVAVAAIDARLARGETARSVVVDVISKVFEPDLDVRVETRLADSATVDRVVAAVLDTGTPIRQ